MIEQWPTALQQYLDQRSFNLTKGNTNVETPMDVGPKKRRRRITKGVDLYTAVIIVDSAGYQTLENFYDNTLAGGINQFEFNHPITGAVETFRFAQPYSYAPVGSQFVVTMNWEKLP